MRLDNMRAVERRIRQIESRWAALQAGYLFGRFQPVGVPFQSVLQEVTRAKPVSCPKDLEDVINAAASRNGLDPKLLKAVIQVESGFKQSAVSRAGAIGLMQLMPATARALGVDPWDPVQNIEGGARYLKQQLDRFGSLEKALAAYNAGPGVVLKYGGVPPYAETRRYIDRVMALIESLSEP
ncbi:MAG: lytic transglycosylase domain-containing protein [Armatimonadota bacterium]